MIEPLLEILDHVLILPGIVKGFTPKSSNSKIQRTIGTGATPHNFKLRLIMWLTKDSLFMYLRIQLTESADS